MCLVGPSVKYLPQMLESLGLPIISYDTQFSPNSRPALSLQLAPTMGQMIDVLFAFLKTFSWSDFSFLCTLSYGCLDEIASIRIKVQEFQRQQKVGIYGGDAFSYRLLSYVNFTDGRDQNEVVDKLKYQLHKDSRINLVHGSGAEVKTIMDVAKELGLTGQEYVWIFTAASISISEENPTVDDSYPLGSFIIGFNSGRDDMETIVKMGVRLWLEGLNSLATSSDVERVDFKTGFSCTLPGDLMFDESGVLKSNKFWIKNVQSSSFYSNNDYTRKSKRHQNKASANLHLPRENLRNMCSELLPGGRNLMSSTAKRSTAQVKPQRHAAPTLYLTQHGTKDVCCTGLCIDLLMRLSEMLHFQVELSEVSDGGYGSPLNKNFTDWNGMLGMLIHNKADMALGALSITPERAATGISIIVAIREGVISPTAFLGYNKLITLPSSYKIDLPLEPYDYPSWSLILVFSVHATGASMFIFEWLSPYGLNQGKTSFSVHKFSLFRSFWLIWSMLFGASVTTDQPRGIASRFLANIWALFAVVFCASYTANLAAFMITKDDFYDLSGIQDWRLKNPHHRHPPFKFATIANSSTDANIEKNYKEIHRYMKSEPQTDVKDAIQNLKKGHIQAFIYDSTTLEYEVGKDDFCKLKTVGKRIAETGYGLAFSKRSQWVQDVNKAILQLQESGEIERLQKFWLVGACHKKKESGVSSHTLGILNFTSAFLLLGAGVLLSIILLILEHIYFRFGRKSLRKCDKQGFCSLVSLSMGQSLTFEQTVKEAMDYHRHYKCKHPHCETQLWKVRHDLDLALLKISQLRKHITSVAHISSQSLSSELSSEQSEKPVSPNFPKFFRENQSTTNYQSTGMSVPTSSLMSELSEDDSDFFTAGSSYNHYNLHTSCPYDTRYSRVPKLNHLKSETNKSESKNDESSVRTVTAKSGNICMNIDEVIGKETSF
ncbi:unnamed protein product [Candidula unifasciata]|uniref:Uncharacterized protein n=1 Tax=Candidula unifasciata TaxID=100452 RepID=A0A8S3ZBQ1_9EUPU|nr:unnamed protein product [Candidula unifasciata]